MGRVRSLVFEVTQRCDHACLHCYNVWKNERPYPRGELGTAETLDLLDRALEQTGADVVTLSGGEPLLREDLVEIVDHLAGRGRSVVLISNGSRLDEATVDRLVPDLIETFELPLLSAEREIHDRMSGVDGAFDRVTRAIAELKLRGQTVVGVFVATRLNLPGWEETIDLALALGVDGLMFNRFNPGGSGRLHLDLLQAAPGELEAALDIAEQASLRYDFPIACSIAIPPCLVDTGRYTRLSFGFCAAGTERAYPTLDPLGNLRPCNHSPTILGNLRRSGFDGLVAGATLQAFVAARPAFCAGCSLELECRGGCKAAAEACFGSASEMDPFLAAYHRQARRRRTG